MPSGPVVSKSGCPRGEKKKKKERHREKEHRADIRCIVNYHKTIFHFFRGYAAF